MSSPLQTRAFNLLPASRLRTTLLLVDIQVGLNTTTTTYYGRARSTPQFEHNVSTLLSRVRSFNASGPVQPINIIHVYHRSTDPNSPLYPGKPTAEIQPCARPVEGEEVISKNATSALVGTDLEGRIRAHGTQQLLVCGIATDHCVSTTVRGCADVEVCGAEDDDGEGRSANSRRRGGVWLVDNCSACFDNHGSFDAQVVHQVNVESLRGEFCEVAGWEEVVEKVLGWRAGSSVLKS